MTYELLAYLSVRATQIGYKACEIPVTRAYPKKGKTPTKISFFKGNSELIFYLVSTLLYQSECSMHYTNFLSSGIRLNTSAKASSPTNKAIM